MPDVLIDTDVFIDHLRGAATMSPSFGAWYSVITRCELFAGAAHEEPAIQALLAPHGEIGIETAVAERAGRLRRALRLSTTDALIAATALARGLVLVTRNRRDFERVPGLSLAST